MEFFNRNVVNAGVEENKFIIALLRPFNQREEIIFKHLKDQREGGMAKKLF